MSGKENDKGGAPIPTANLEPDARHGTVGEEATEGLDTRVHIRVISFRKRKHDIEGVSVKAVLDGIVRLGLLPDDSSEEIKAVTFESRICEKGQEEQTIIEWEE